MTIQWISGDSFTCVSTDTKPVLVPVDTKAIETNTEDIWRFNGTSWVLFSANDKTESLTNKTIDFDLNTIANKFNVSYVVYKSGAVYKARDMVAGTTLSSDSNPAVVLQAAITPGKDVYISGGDYTFPAGFTSISFPSSSTGKMSRVTAATDAKFIVPQGYADAVFKMATYVNNCRYSGGRFEEAGTPARNWYPFELRNDGTLGPDGTVFNQVGDYFAKQAKALIKLSCYMPLSWVNSNKIHEITGWDCKYVIEFYQDPAASIPTGEFPTPLAHHFAANVFSNIGYQTDLATLIGVKDIQGESNVFENVTIWDLQHGNNNTGAKSGNILSNARFTKVLYGTLADSLLAQPEQDKSAGQDTICVAYNNTSKYPRSLEDSFDTKRKYGRIVPSLANTFDGILTGLGTNLTGSNTVIANNIWYTVGTYVRYPTGNVAGNRAGRVFPNVAVRSANSKFSIRWNLNELPSGTCRAWFGFTTNMGDPTGDTEASGKEVFMLGFRAADTNYQCIHNDGGTPAIYNDTGIGCNNTSQHTLQVMADEPNTRFLWKVDTTGWNAVTTDIPGISTLMGIVFGIQITNTTVRTFDVLDLEAKIDVI